MVLYYRRRFRQHGKNKEMKALSVVIDRRTVQPTLARRLRSASALPADIYSSPHCIVFKITAAAYLKWKVIATVQLYLA